MKDDFTRRRFLKYGIISAGTFIATASLLSVDIKTGFKIGENPVKTGLPEAKATCGASYSCSGGGGECGSSYSCSGGGGQCGSSYNCAGQ